LDVINSEQTEEEALPSQGRNVVIVPRPAYNSTANITSVLGYYRDGLREAGPPEERSKAQEQQNSRSDPVHGPNGYVTADVVSVEDDILADFMPAEEFFSMAGDTSRNLGAEFEAVPGKPIITWTLEDEEANGRLTPPEETMLTTGVKVRPLFPDSSIAVSGHFRAEESGGAEPGPVPLEFIKVPQTSSSLEMLTKREELLALPRKASIAELSETLPVVEAENTESSVGSSEQVDLGRRIAPFELHEKVPEVPAEATRSTGPSAASPEPAGPWRTLEPSQATPDLSSLDIVVDKHSPRLLDSKEQLPAHSGTADKKAVTQGDERSAKGSLFKYYGNHQFVGVAKADAQGELSALVNFLSQQPQHKQARFVDASKVGNDKEEKSAKSPIYIKYTAGSMLQTTGKSEDPLMKREEETTTEAAVTRSTTVKAGGMNRAGYSYSGFDFNDR
jgi:hypothetical protein